MKKIILALVQQINDYIFTSIMVAFCIFIFFFIPQINLIFELPQLALSKDFFLSLLLFFFLALLALIYGKASFLVIPHEEDEPRSSVLSLFLNRPFTPFFFIILIVVTLILFGVLLSQKLVQFSDFFILFPLVFIMGSGLGLNNLFLKQVYIKVKEKQLFVLPGTLCLVLTILCLFFSFYSEGIFVGLCGLWFFSHKAQPFLERFFESNTTTKTTISVIYETLGRSLFFFFFSLILGELLFQGAIQTQQLFSYRNYTLWGIAHLFFTFILCARILDEIKSLRVLLLSAPVLFFLLLQPIILGKETEKTSSDPKIITEKQTQLAVQWLKSFKQRMDKIPSDQPVFFVASAGGGSRAALFTALVLESLGNPYKYANQITDCVNGDEREDPYAYFRTPAENYTKNIVLLSSVSGGSLACAYFAHTDTTHQHAFVRNSLEDQLVHEIQRLLQERAIFKVSGAYSGPNEKAIRQWISATFVDDMCTDFIAPLLRGVLFRLDLERGESVSEVWENEFLWKNVHNQQNFSDSCKPLLILNSADVEKGVRFAIGFPPLPTKSLFSETAGDVMLTLSDWKPFYQLQLAEAVRLSANFPWGFEVAQLTTQQSLLNYFGTHTSQSVFLTDGGVTDNTGIDSITMILKRLRFYAESTVSEGNNADPCLQENKVILSSEAKTLANEAKILANEILKELANRGLIIIEIDSGAKPDKTQTPAALRPLQALNSASFANAILAKTKNYESIEKYLNPKKEKPEKAIPWSFISFENPGEVVTTWALGPKDKAITVVDFLEEWIVNEKEKKLKRQTMEFQLLNKLTRISKAFETILLQTEVKKMSLILNDPYENKYKKDFFDTNTQQQEIHSKINSLQQQVSNQDLSDVLEIWKKEHSRERLRNNYAELTQKGFAFKEETLKKMLQDNIQIQENSLEFLKNFPLHYELTKTLHQQLEEMLILEKKAEQSSEVLDLIDASRPFFFEFNQKLNKYIDRLKERQEQLIATRIKELPQILFRE